MPKIPAETATCIRTLAWTVEDLREAVRRVDEAFVALNACDLANVSETLRRVIGANRRTAQSNAKALHEVVQHVAMLLDVNTGTPARASVRVGEPVPVIPPITCSDAEWQAYRDAMKAYLPDKADADFGAAISDQILTVARLGAMPTDELRERVGHLTGRPLDRSGC